MRTLLLATTLLIFAASASADMFKCQEGGKTVYSDQPCAVGAKKVEVRPATGYSPTSDASSAAATRDWVKKSNASVQTTIIDEDIRRLSVRIQTLNAERDQRLATLRERKTRTNNNLAGAILDSSLSQEMTATNAEYDAKIRAVQTQIDELKAKKSAIAKAE